MGLLWWRKERTIRTSEKLETLERQISETEYRLRNSQERLGAIKFHIAVIGFAAIVSSLLWIITNIRSGDTVLHTLPLIVSVALFVLNLFSLSLCTSLCVYFMLVVFVGCAVL